MIPEREREALMRLTMCARIECDICIYKGDSIEKCDERITKNMNILADALRADCKTEPTISKMEQVETILEEVEAEPQMKYPCDTCANKGDHVGECQNCVADSAPFRLKTPSHYKPKTEPQTDCGDFADRLAYERGVKHAWEVAQKVFDSTVTFYEAEDVAKQIDKDINVRSKDEPQTDGYISGEDFMKIFNEPQTDCAWK